MASFKNSTPYFFIHLSLFGLLSFAIGASSADIEYDGGSCDPKTIFKNNSTLEANRNALLLSLISNATWENGFFSDTEGQGTSDSITGIFLCRGDVTPATCQECVRLAAKMMPKHCPVEADALILYNFCTLYTSQSFEFDKFLSSGGMTCPGRSRKASIEQTHLNGTLRELVEVLIPKVANSDKKYATSEVLLTAKQKLYGLGQCIPDLTPSDCTKCLNKAAFSSPWCLSEFVYLAGCNMNMDVLPYVSIGIAPNIPPAPAAAPAPGKTGRRSLSVIKTIVSIVIVISFMLFSLGCYLLWRKTRKNDRAILRENFGEESSKLKSLQFDLTIIEAATNKFAHQNRIGEGGFGEVYKGTLPDGREIAVKRLSKNSRQGVLEFKNEVLLIEKLQHRNLVALLGFCLDKEEKILIYEYVPNKSIDCFIFGTQKQRLLNWSERLKIIRGIAGGLIYLHEHSRLKVIHRDLKPSNILLDNNLNPKISDFGMARMIDADQEKGNTNKVVGTFGYMAPEYVRHGQFSEKSDVFSFGVIILEMISGKRIASSQESHLLTYAWKQWNDEKPLDILDPYLKGSHSEIDQVIQCVQIGLLCVQENPNHRPTMSQILFYLSNFSIELPIPREPAYFIHGREIHTCILSSLNEMSDSELLAR